MSHQRQDLQLSTPATQTFHLHASPHHLHADHPHHHSLHGKHVPPGSRIYNQALDDLRHESGDLSSSSSSCDSSCSCSSCSSSASSIGSRSSARSPYSVIFKAELRHHSLSPNSASNKHHSSSHNNSSSSRSDGRCSDSRADLNFDLDPVSQGRKRDLIDSSALSVQTRSPGRARCHFDSDSEEEDSPQSLLSARRAREQTPSPRIGRRSEGGGSNRSVNNGSCSNSILSGGNERDRRGSCGSASRQAETKSKTQSSGSSISDVDRNGGLLDKPCLQISDFLEDLNLEEYNYYNGSSSDHNSSSRHSSRAKSTSSNGVLSARGQSEKDSGMGPVSSLLLHKRDGGSIPGSDSVDSHLHHLHKSHHRAASPGRRNSSPNAGKDSSVDAKEPRGAASAGPHGRHFYDVTNGNGASANGNNGQIEGLLGGGIDEGEVVGPASGHVVSWSMSSGCKGNSQYFTNSDEPDDSSSPTRPHPPLSRLYPRSPTAGGSVKHSSSSSSSGSCRLPVLSTEGWGRDPDLDQQQQRKHGSSTPRHSSHEGRRGDSEREGTGDVLMIPIAGGFANSSSSSKRSASPAIRGTAVEPLPYVRNGLEPPTHDPCVRSRSSPVSSSSNPNHLRTNSPNSQRVSSSAANPHTSQHHIRLCAFGPAGDSVDGASSNVGGSKFGDLPQLPALNSDTIGLLTSNDGLRPRSQSDASLHAARRRRLLPRPPLPVHATAEEPHASHVHWADEHSGSPLATSVLLNSIRPRSYSYGAADLPRKPILKKPFGF